MDTNNETVEMRILRYIDANGPASSVELAKELQVGLETITDILRDGARQRFVGREYDEDNCCVVYTIAARGRNALADDNAARAPRTKTKEQLLLERVEELEGSLRLANNAIQASNDLLAELVNQPDESGSFMVSVDGGMGPSREYADLDAAKKAAESTVQIIKAGKIRILRLVDTLEINTASMTTAVWDSDKQQINEALDAMAGEQCDGCEVCHGN